jgi:hypothetical protein
LVEMAKTTWDMQRSYWPKRRNRSHQIGLPDLQHPKTRIFLQCFRFPQKSRYILVYYIIYIYIYTYIYIIYVYIYIHNYIYIMYVIMKYIYMYIVFFHPRRPFRRAPGGMGHQAGLYSGLVLLRLPDAPSTRRASRILWHECHQEWCP